MSDFQDLLELATSSVQTGEPDENVMNELCNLIWNLEVDPKEALLAIHDKIADKNPEISYYGLVVLENAFYKCGSFIYGPICTPSYMELLKNIIKTTKHKKIRNKIFKMLLEWSDIFEHLYHFNKPIQDLLLHLEISNNGEYINLLEIKRQLKDVNVYQTSLHNKLTPTKECSVNIVKCDLKVSKI